MTHRERELLEALKHVAATSDPKTARFALRVLGVEAGPVLFRSGLAGEVDRGFDEIDRALGAGTTSADLQRYRDALACHHHYRLIPLGFENRWSTVTG